MASFGRTAFADCTAIAMVKNYCSEAVARERRHPGGPPGLDAAFLVAGGLH
jgi:hypothetical protein